MKAKLLQFKFLVYAASIVVVSSFLLSLAYKQVAAEEYIFDQVTSEESIREETGGWAIPFTADTNNISSFSFKFCKQLSDLAGDSNFGWISVCAGDLLIATTTSFWNACMGNAVLGTYQISPPKEEFNNLSDCPNYSEVNFDIADINLTVGNNYFIHMYNWNLNADIVSKDKYTTNTLQDMVWIDYISGTGSFTYTYKTDTSYWHKFYSTEMAGAESVEIIELPPFTGNVEIGSETLQIYPDTQTCYAEDDCYITVIYPYDEVNNNFVFAEYDSSFMDFYTVAATSTLYDYDLKKLYLKVTAATSTGTHYYCGILDRTPLNSFEQFEDEWYCGTTIKWKSGHEADDLGVKASPAYMKCMDITDNFASSSDVGWLENVAKWLIAPTESACYRIAASSEKLRQNFPFSYGSQILLLFDYASASTSAGIHVPLKWWNPTTGQYEDTGADLLSTTTLAIGMAKTMNNGDTLYEFYWKWFSYALYIATFLYILFRIIKIINPNFTAEKRHVDWTNVYDKPQRTQIIKQRDGSHKVKIIED